MTKLRSLIFREFKVCQKQYIIRAVLLFALFAFFIGGDYIFITLLQEEPEKEKMIKGFAETFSMVIIFWSTLFFAEESTFKTDLNSGWNNYSYALPLSAAERSAVRLICFAIITGIAVLLGMLCVFAINLISGTPFQIGYAVLQLIFLDLLLLAKIITEFFVLRARNTDEYKKMNEKGSLICVAAMICIALIILKCVGFDFAALLDTESTEPLTVDIVSKLTGGMLLWLIPLTLALGYAYYRVIYHCLQYAYSGGAGIKKASLESEKTVNLTAPHSEPVGFLYKELRQNRRIICVAAALPFLLQIFLMGVLALISLNENNDLKGGVLEALTSDTMRIVAAALGYFVAGGLMLDIFHGDDRKLWAYFTACAPTGVKKFLYTKYALSFAMCGLYFASSYFAETLAATVHWFAAGKEANALTGVFIMIFFLMLVENSFKIPMMLRFGEKRGSIINLIIMLGIGIAAVLVLAFLPEEVQNKLFTWLAGFITGEHDDLTMLMVGLFPFISVGAYILSYKISCKVFMKGVNEYDR